MPTGFRASRGLRNHVVMNLFRPWKNFRENPSSIRWAAAAIMSVTVALVLVGAAVMRIFDSEEYPTFGGALWFTLQTVTTVGYGDVTPTSVVGRVFATAVMLFSIGLITVITAIITSLFIEAARAQRRQSEGDETVETLARIEASLTTVQLRLDLIESQLNAPPPTGSDKN